MWYKVLFYLDGLSNARKIMLFKAHLLQGRQPNEKSRTRREIGRVYSEFVLYVTGKWEGVLPLDGPKLLKLFQDLLTASVTLMRDTGSIS